MRKQAFTLIEPPAVRQGFTLIELLVVIAILSLLVSILLPSLTKARELAKDITCKTKLRNLCVGLSLYLEDSRGIFPIGDYYGSWGQADTWKHTIQRHSNLDDEAFLCPTDKLSETGFQYGSYLINSYNWSRGIASRYSSTFQTENSIDMFPSPADKVALIEGQNICLYTQQGLLGEHAGHSVRYIHDDKANILWLDMRAGDMEIGDVADIKDAQKLFDYRF